MFPNLDNAQLSKKLKQQIENNDVFSIQLKLKTQVEVNVKTTLEKAPINGEHIHVHVCRFKSPKGLLSKSHYKIMSKRCIKKSGTKDGKIKGGPSLKKQPINTSNKHILDVPQ